MFVLNDLAIPEWRRPRHRVWMWAVALCTVPAVCGAVASLTAPEQQLLTAIGDLRSGDSGGALKTLQELVQKEPNFRLAQLLYGEVLAERSGAAGGELPADQNDPRVRDLLDEYHSRVSAQESAPASSSLPRSILRLSSAHRYAIVADLPRSRVYVLENQNGRLKRIGDYYASIARNGYGKQTAGDLRTPVGIYRVTSFTPGFRLPPFYGAGAFPLNYPNSWDRAHGRTGSGIWLHGVPITTFVRPPRASEGCVVFANQDLVSLRSVIVPGTTPVVLSDGVDWLTAAEVGQQRDDLLARIESWRQKWSALDTEAYLSFYADTFRTDDGMTKGAFAEYKRRVNQGKHNVSVALEDIDLFAYPGEPNLVLAEFTQKYRSDNFVSSSRKEQYWRHDADGHWRIVREENRVE